MAVLLVAAVLRVQAMERSFPVRLRGDETSFVATSVNLARRGTYDTGTARAFRPPGQSFFLSRFVPSRSSHREFKSQQILKPLVRAELWLGVLLVAVTLALGHALFGMRAALAAGALAAVDPTLIAFSHYLWSETLFALLLSVGLLAAVWSQRRGSLWLAALAGGWLGLAGLTREIGLLVGLAIACSLAWRGWRGDPSARRTRLAQGALVVAVAACVVLPWTLRNYALFGRIVPVSTIGWMGMWEGNSFPGRNWLRPSYQGLHPFRKRMNRIGDEMKRMDVMRRESLTLIRDAQPSWILKKVTLNTALLFNPDNMLLQKIGNGGYGKVSRAWRRFLLVASTGFYVFVVVVGLLGAAAAERGRAIWLALPMAVICAVHWLANANPRYRLPVMPVLMAYAGFALVECGNLRSRLHPRRAAGALAALAVFLLWCVPYFWRTAVRSWG